MPSLAWPRKTLSEVGTKEALGLLLMLLFLGTFDLAGSVSSPKCSVTTSFLKARPCSNHYGSKSRKKRPCEEKSVDVEKPESSNGTVREQFDSNLFIASSASHVTIFT
jgi:hypothetical protein